MIYLVSIWGELPHQAFDLLFMVRRCCHCKYIRSSISSFQLPYIIVFVEKQELLRKNLIEDENFWKLIQRGYLIWYNSICDLISVYCSYNHCNCKLSSKTRVCVSLINLDMWMWLLQLKEVPIRHFMKPRWGNLKVNIHSTLLNIRRGTSLGFPMHCKLPSTKIPKRSHRTSASSMECAAYSDTNFLS